MCLAVEAQMGQRLGLPTWGLAGASDSMMLDGQAGAESTFSILSQGLAGLNLIHDVGYLGAGMICSPEMLVMGDEIWLEPTVGHSVGHVAVHLRSGHHHAVMCGDLIHTPLQLAEPGWSPTFEFDRAASTNTRRTFLNTHCETETLVLTAHFPSPSIGHIVPRGNGYDFSYL